MKPEVSAGCHQTLSHRWGLGTRLDVLSSPPSLIAERAWIHVHIQDVYVDTGNS